MEQLSVLPRILFPGVALVGTFIQMTNTLLQAQQQRVYEMGVNVHN